MPQSVLPGEDHFWVFGVARRFSQDGAELERRFYRVSRALHPDRFSAAAPEARKASLERMSLLNDAYATLRNPEALRDYVLKLEGISVPKAQLPAELAESWFELQDTLAEDPAAAAARLAGFETALKELQARAEGALRSRESALDRDGLPREGLEKLAHEIQARAYLKSLERDVERLRARFLR